MLFMTHLNDHFTSAIKPKVEIIRIMFTGTSKSSSMRQKNLRFNYYRYDNITSELLMSLMDQAKSLGATLSDVRKACPVDKLNEFPASMNVILSTPIMKNENGGGISNTPATKPPARPRQGKSANRPRKATNSNPSHDQSQSSTADMISDMMKSRDEPDEPINLVNGKNFTKQWLKAIYDGTQANDLEYIDLLLAKLSKMTVHAGIYPPYAPPPARTDLPAIQVDSKEGITAIGLYETINKFSVLDFEDIVDESDMNIVTAVPNISKASKRAISKPTPRSTSRRTK